MRYNLLFLSAFIITPAVAHAGPDATIQHLLNDSASMMDFGLLRLNMRLDARKLGEAFYDWQENRIKIQTYRPRSDSSVAAEKDCADRVANIRRSAGVNSATGKAVFGNSFFANFFDHSGFKRTSSPEALSTEIDKIIVINCIGIDDDLEVSVTAPLLGTGYSLEK